MEEFPINFDHLDIKENDKLEQIEEKTVDLVLNAYEEKLNYQKEIIKTINPSNNDEKALNIIKEVIRSVLIRKIDEAWQKHLLHIDHLRSDVSLRAIGQRDPLIEFKHEAFKLFSEFSQKLKIETSLDLFRFEMVPPERQKLQDTISKLQMHTQKSFVEDDDTNRGKY